MLGPLDLHLHALHALEEAAQVVPEQPRAVAADEAAAARRLGLGISGGPRSLGCAYIYIYIYIYIALEQAAQVVPEQPRAVAADEAAAARRLGLGISNV